jgi:hypothetical protein
MAMRLWKMIARTAMRSIRIETISSAYDRWSSTRLTGHRAAYVQNSCYTGQLTDRKANVLESLRPGQCAGQLMYSTAYSMEGKLMYEYITDYV